LNRRVGDRRAKRLAGDVERCRALAAFERLVDQVDLLLQVAAAELVL
jgi:hypothetical protein